MKKQYKSTEEILDEYLKFAKMNLIRATELIGDEEIEERVYDVFTIMEHQKIKYLEMVGV